MGFERNEIQRDEGKDQFLDLARSAQHAHVGATIGNHRQVFHGAAQNLAHQCHRLAPGAPTAKSHGHAVLDLRNRFCGAHLFIGHNCFVLLVKQLR